MDYSKFLEDSFDHKKWINAAFKGKEADQPLDQHTSNLVMKLQVYMQEVNTIIEENCQQAVQSIPRVLRELDSARQEASLLQDSMRAVRKEIEAVERETSRSMSTLVVMETVKTRMKNTEHALREADSWTTLSENVDEVLASGDVEAIAEKICGLQQSLSMLTAVGDYAARVKKVEDLKNILETLVSPRAVQAFASHNQTEAANYVSLLTRVGRGNQAARYYEAWMRSRVDLLWQEAMLKFERPMDALDELYRLLSQLWNEEIKSSVFENPVLVVSQTFTACLNNVSEPSVESFVAETIRDAADKLATVEGLLQRSDWFATTLKQSIEMHNPVLLSTDDAIRLAGAVYGPYRGLPAIYETQQQEHLERQLAKIPLDHSDVGETMDLLNASVKAVVELSQGAVNRCQSSTHGTASPQLLNCLKNLYTSYVAELRRVVVNVKEKCISAGDESGENLSRGLQLTVVVGELHLQFDAFVEELLSSMLAWLRPQAQDPHSSPFTDFPQLLLDTGEMLRSHKSLAGLILDGVSPPALVEVRNSIRQLSEFVHSTVFGLVFAPVRQLLDRFPTQEEVWGSATANEGVLTEELPSFGYTPQEGVTKIGQFFMTLPQQLAVYLTGENPALSCAIACGKLPFVPEDGVKESGGEVWLESLAQATMHHLVEAVLKIRHLSAHGNKQLMTDIDYIVSVLDDLDLPASANLRHLRDLVAATVDGFDHVAAETPRRLASHIRAARSIPSDFSR